MDRYEEALERAKKGLPIDEVFPELKESEDERIRKGLLEIFNKAQFGEWGKLKIKDIIAWLERQKEQQPAECIVPPPSDPFMFNLHSTIYNFGKQVAAKCLDTDILDTELDEYVTDENVDKYIEKHISCLVKYHPLQQPAEWSEEDERTLESFLGWLQGSMGEKTYSSWLKSLPERFSLKPKQEWSEEFLRLMGITISQDGNQVCVLLGENLAEGIAGFGDTLADAVEEFKKEWRQFDRFRKATWKPSEEQIRTLDIVISDYRHACTKDSDKKAETLKPLLEQLEKL